MQGTLQNALSKLQQIVQAVAPEGVVQQLQQQLQQTAGRILSSQRAQDLVHVAMQHFLAAASIVASLLLLLATIAAGWFALWHTTMKDVGFFRELLGLNKPKPAVKAQMLAERDAEIERIKRQHSRSSVRNRTAS